MPPIFPRRSNLIAKASILVGLLLVVVVIGVWYWWVHSSAFTRVGVSVPQPVNFPHNVHVGALGLDCRYCHSFVDKADFADLPPTETCMTCHSQIATNSPALQAVRQSWQTGQPIAWNRVNRLPGFVYFSHQIHVNKGIGCEFCHGRVDQMTTDVKEQTFYMGFCLDCHKNPAKNLRPLDQVYKMGYQPPTDQRTLGNQLMQEYRILPVSQLINCDICHR